MLKRSMMRILCFLKPTLHWAAQIANRSDHTHTRARARARAHAHAHTKRQLYKNAAFSHSDTHRTNAEEMKSLLRGETFS
jgi:hypothetical protein